MAAGTTGGAARGSAIAGAVSILVGIVVSLTTDENVAWAWGAMVLTTLLGLVLLAIAAILVVRRRLRDRRALV